MDVTATQGTSPAPQTGTPSPQQGNTPPSTAWQQTGGTKGGAAAPSARSMTQAAEGKGGNSPTQPDRTSKSPDPTPAAGAQEYFDVKVNGKSVRMSKQEVLDYASMSHAANSKFEEAAKLRKSVDGLIQTAKKNPIEALMNPALGLSKEQIRDAMESWYMKEFVEPEQMSPEQRRIRELEAEVNKTRQEREEQARAEQEKQELELTHRQREHIQSQIIEALERSGLPKTKGIAARVAYYMRENLQRGWEAPMDLIIKQVKEERQAHWQGEVGSLKGQDLINYLGEDVVNEIRRHDLARLRDQRAQKAPAFQGQQSQSDGYGNREKISSKDVAQRLRELRMGKR